jgi:hypothetical protein
MTTIRASRRKKIHCSTEILRYRKEPVSRSTVRAAYEKWCLTQGLPYRCTFEDCPLHVETPRWRGSSLRLILDHTNGNPCDNDPKNLRWVCPNCNSQLPTHGGRNRGRVVQNEIGGYSLRRQDGLIEYRLKAETGIAVAAGLRASIGTEAPEPK